MKLVMMSGEYTRQSGEPVASSTEQSAYNTVRRMGLTEDVWHLYPRPDRERVINIPDVRDTFPAIVYGTSYLTDLAGVPDNEVIMFAPVELLANERVVEAILSASKALTNNGNNLAVMGCEYSGNATRIIITEPSVSATSWLPVKSFVEYVDGPLTQEGFKDCGVYGFQPAFLKRFLREKGHPWNHFVIHSTYRSLPAVSFNYAVVEQIKGVVMIPLAGDVALA